MKTKVPFAFNILLNMIPIPPLFLSVCLEKLLLEYPGGDNAATNSNGVLVLIEAKFSYDMHVNKYYCRSQHAWSTILIRP